MISWKKVIAIALMLSAVVALSGCAAMEDEAVNAIAMEAISSVLSVVAQLASRAQRGTYLVCYPHSKNRKI